MGSIYWTSFHSCISVNHESLGWVICQSGWGTRHFKKFWGWSGGGVFPSNGRMLLGFIPFCGLCYYAEIISKCSRVLLSFNYLTTPQKTLVHYQGGSLTHSMLITVFLHIQPKDHWEPHYEVGSLNPATKLVQFELRFFQFQ